MGDFSPLNVLLDHQTINRFEPVEAGVDILEHGLITLPVWDALSANQMEKARCGFGV